MFGVIKSDMSDMICSLIVEFDKKIEETTLNSIANKYTDIIMGRIQELEAENNGYKATVKELSRINDNLLAENERLKALHEAHERIRAGVKDFLKQEKRIQELEAENERLRKENEIESNNAGFWKAARARALAFGAETSLPRTWCIKHLINRREI
jgi:FtsZ-binding cell division protein ZapB